MQAPPAGDMFTLSALRKLARHPPSTSSAEAAPALPALPPNVDHPPVNVDRLPRANSHQTSAPTDRSQASSLFSLEPDEALHAAAWAQASLVQHTTTTTEAGEPLEPSCSTAQASGTREPAPERRSLALAALKERRTLQRCASGEGLHARLAVSMDGSVQGVGCVHQGVECAPPGVVRAAPQPLVIPGSDGLQSGAVRKATSPPRGRSPGGRQRGAARCVCMRWRLCTTCDFFTCTGWTGRMCRQKPIRTSTPTCCSGPAQLRRGRAARSGRHGPVRRSVPLLPRVHTTSSSHRCGGRALVTEACVSHHRTGDGSHRPRSAGQPVAPAAPFVHCVFAAIVAPMMLQTTRVDHHRYHVPAGVPGAPPLGPPNEGRRAPGGGLAGGTLGGGRVAREILWWWW